MSDQNNNGLLHKILENQGDMKADIARLETTVESHFQQNDQAHNQMHSNIVDVKERVRKLEESDDRQDSILDQRIGSHKLGWSIVGFVVVIFSGAAGYYLPKIFKFIAGL